VGENSNTYPVGPTNGIIAGDATSVVWDPWSYNQNAGSQVRLFLLLLTFSCRLLFYPYHVLIGSLSVSQL
jgi:hypothetical protein